MDSSTRIKIESCLEKMNFSCYGYAQLKKPETIDAYKEWLNNNFHGTMKYLQDHLGFKEFPQTLIKNCNSAIVLSKDYFPTHQNSISPLKNIRMAEYAKNEDYHFWFQEELEKSIERLKQEFPSETFVAMTDSKPVLERDLAQRAGLGWFGKNTCLIHSKQGSLFFIGEIYTSLELQSVSAIHPDRCGTCTKCIDACPTEAIIKPYVLDANKCISYLTIEKKGDIDKKLLSKMNDWFFGCDICQSICPWNEKVFGQDIKKEQASVKPVTQDLVKELRWILSTSGKSLLKQLKGSPLVRARGSGLKRNALIIIGNQKIKELLPEVKASQKQPSLEQTAQWCENQLT